MGHAERVSQRAISVVTSGRCQSSCLDLSRESELPPGTCSPFPGCSDPGQGTRTELESVAPCLPSTVTLLGYEPPGPQAQAGVMAKAAKISRILHFSNTGGFIVLSKTHKISLFFPLSVPSYPEGAPHLYFVLKSALENSIPSPRTCTCSLSFPPLSAS